MKHWIIESTESFDTYLIATEKAIWLTDQQKEIDINALIETKNLGKIKNIKYEDLKEIVFINSDFTIEFNYSDDDTTDEEISNIDKDIYAHIRSYLKTNLKGTQLKNYSVFKQIMPHLLLLGFFGLLTGLVYFAALKLENGSSIRVAGIRGWQKLIVASIAEVLGTTGTLIIGFSIMGLLTYFLIKKLKHPKVGEILEIIDSPKLLV